MGDEPQVPDRPDEPADTEAVEPPEHLVGEPLFTAFIEGETFAGPKAVQYTVVDGLAIFEGDIVLGAHDAVQRRTDELRGELATRARGIAAEAVEGDVVDPDDPSFLEAVVVTGQSRRWPGGIVPFEVTTNLPAGCLFGQAVHEIGHAVGLWHEQSREDRNTFVQILWQNIQPGQSHNFDQQVNDGDDVGPYDYGSIMHYGATAFGNVVPPSTTPQTTIVALQAMPPGVTMGQRNGLSIGDRGAVAWMYGGIYPGRQNTWVGRFRGAGDELLYYSPARRHWDLSQRAGTTMTFVDVSDTTGFGDLTDGRPIWVGDFTGDGRTDVLFYYPGDDNWWLGSLQGGSLAWSLVGNTAGFGHAINDGRPFWIGDFTGDGRADVLFYYPGDDNWWLGRVVIGQLVWSFVCNTAGFGHAINDGRPFWVGDFTGDGRTDVLFYFPGDDNWWLGSLADQPA